MTTPVTTTSIGPSSGLYYRFTIPMALRNLIMKIVEDMQGDPNFPVITPTQSNRVWFSQPRAASDPTTEVLSVNFSVPVSVTNVSWEALRVSCAYELWYIDTDQNTRQALDAALNPIVLSVSPSGTRSWYPASFEVYPIVCTSLQFRITRVPNVLVGNSPYVVGMRNTLIEREINNREQGVTAINQQQDAMGNIISSYIRDWSASNAIDNNAFTYWKCAPQPAANAVVTLSLDLRDPDGDPQVVDTVYIDPVYTGNNLNLYYSNDETQSTLSPSPESLLPTDNDNVVWQDGVGLEDVSTTLQTSDYEFPMTWGPLVDQDAWIGVEWSPNFSSVPTTAVQTITITGNPTGGGFILIYTDPNTQTKLNTTTLAYNTSDLDVQDALEYLVGGGNVSVLGPDGGPFTVTFSAQLQGQNIPLLGSVNSLINGQNPSIDIIDGVTGGESGPPPQNCILFRAQPEGIDGSSAIQQVFVQNNPTSGSYTLSYGNVASGSIMYNATATQVLTALNEIQALAGNVSVSSATGSSDVFTITFTGTLANQPISNLVPTSALGGSNVGSGKQVISVTGYSGFFTLSYNGQTTEDISYNSPASVVESALNGTLQTPEIQTISMQGFPSGGSFSLVWSGNDQEGSVDGLSQPSSVSSQIPFNATTGEVEDALNALPGLSVDVSGSPENWVVQFNIPGPQPLLSVYSSANLEGGTNPGVTVSRLQAGNVPISVTGNPGGPFTVSFGGDLTGSTSLLTAASSGSADVSVSYAGDVSVVTSTPGVVPVLSLNPSQYFPAVYYDSGSNSIVLEFSLNSGATPLVYSCPLADFDAGSVMRIVAGWTYSPNSVQITVQSGSGNTIGSYAASNVPLPTQMSVDGSIQFKDFKGIFTAHAVKLEPYALTSSAFLANAQSYVTAPPPTTGAAGTEPTAAQQDGILFANWKLQEFANGGASHSKYGQRLWTPIFTDYITEKGDLTLPSAISMKYLQLEFSNLTPQPYPIYKDGIKVHYQTFPASVTQTSVQPLGQLGELAGLLTLGADVVLSGLVSVNWLNPQSVNNAANNMFGQIYQPMIVTTGGATNTNVPAIPNTSNQMFNGQARVEVASPIVYTRAPQSATTLAGQYISTQLANQSQQGVAQPGVIQLGNGITWTPQVANSAPPATTPVQGDDWWVFGGGTLKMPAQVMNGITGNTEVSLGPGLSTLTRYRFTTTAVHTYATKTVTLDAAVAFFCGIREVQPYVTTYIELQSPPVFKFTRYDLKQWSGVNVTQLSSGPVTTEGHIYAIENPEFDPDQQKLVGVDGKLIDETIPGNENTFVNDWIQAQGEWSWDGTIGESGPLGAAIVTADGQDKVLLSSFVETTPGMDIDLSVAVWWQDLVASSPEAIQLQAWFYGGTPPTPTTPDVVSFPIAVQGTYITDYPELLATTSLTTGGGSTGQSMLNNVGELVGNDWIRISATVNGGNPLVVPADATYMRVALVVNSAATAGQVAFDNVEIEADDDLTGQLFNTFTTLSTFNKVTCSFQDSGAVQSDSMWQLPDATGTTGADTALAYYVETIPNIIPAGMWGDTVADWADPHIAWGDPRAVVAISLDPSRTYNGRRVLHFTRAAGYGVAGIQMRQQTNFIPNGLCRMVCTFLKPSPPSSAAPNNTTPTSTTPNEIQIELVRTSDGVVIHSETFTPVEGYWYTYQSKFFEIPDSDDQIYTLSTVLTGDNSDSLYLNDMYCEIAQIRYFVTMGGDGNYLHDVTPLAYVDNGNAIVSSPIPVNSFTVDVTILSSDAYVYSSSFTPQYLDY